jgi:hypothetical protein
VGDAALALDDPGALQLGVPGIPLAEETAPLAEEHEMDLELVEDPGSEFGGHSGSSPGGVADVNL